ncbi:MAG: amidohydrolase family protein [Candidatus Altiarchaeales archaeon]|nr:amidohydrolase family protein [Candidatus Altiarchaeales archaeon]MBD3416269.1 amidohydrolase family protein [Candidatus Altiarchaeales archaeon]
MEVPALKYELGDSYLYGGLHNIGFRMVGVPGGKLLIKNAATPHSRSTTDILVEDGAISAVGTLEGEGMDVGGRLVMPGFVNVHTHLDKADLLSKMSPDQYGKSLEENRELLKALKKNYRVEEIRERAGRVIDEFIANGVTAIRTQVDVDATGGLKPLEALTQLRDASRAELQICAFPQEGVLREDCLGRVEDALKSGADLLGGLPLVEKTREEQLQHIEVLCELAVKHDVDLEVQVDESNNPEDFLLPVLAEKTIEYGLQGRVSATHCISLSAVDDKIAQETIRLVKEAMMNVIVTPSANMITRFDTADDVHSRASNSITRVKELLAAGVNVAVGTDNIRDIFYPLGNCSMLRELHVLASATRMTGEEDPVRLLGMGSANGASIMGLNYGLEKGCTGDLIVLNARNAREALNTTPVIPYVIKGGHVVCESVHEVEHGG